MKTTKSIILLVMLTIGLAAHAQSANEFASQYKDQEGINYHELTAFVGEVKKRFEQMPANGMPGEMPEGVPSIEELKAFYNKVKTLELIVTSDRSSAFKMFGALLRLNGYVPLIFYTEDAEEPKYVDGPDNVRRLHLPAAYRVEGFIYQAFGKIDEKDQITDLILFNLSPEIGLVTCVTGQLVVEDLRMLYSMQQMMQMMQRNQQPRGPRP